jgi:hypothetical protein
VIGTGTLLDSLDNLLRQSGFESGQLSFEAGAMSRVFENQHLIAGIAAFETLDDLVTGWQDAEDQLVRLASTKLDKSDDKAWDLYLILASVDMSDGYEEALEKARIDTRRSRKLPIAAGDKPEDQLLMSYLRRQLASILPIPEMPSRLVTNPLDEVSARSGQSSPIPHLILGYRQGEALLPRLHAWMNTTKDGSEAL